jgi:hypothetical protein
MSENSSSRRFDRRRALDLAVAAAAVLALVALVFVRTHPGGSNQVTASISSVGGTPVGDGTKLVIGKGISVLPKIITANGDPLDYSQPGLENPDLPGGLAYEQLTNVDSLKAWALCSQELIAEAESRNGRADVMYRFPQNAPLNRGKTLDAWYVDRAKQLRSSADGLRAAARLAESAHIPCVKPGQEAVVANFVKVTARDQELLVPDYSVFRFSEPVEYFQATHWCARLAAEDLAELKAAKLDTKKGSKGPLNTFSEWDKYGGQIVAEAEMRLVTDQNVSC